MAEPFSVITATAGVIDVCWRFGAYLYDVKAGAAQIEDDIETLSRDIEALRVVNETVRDSYKELSSHLGSGIESSKHIERLWRNVSSNLGNCQSVLEELEVLVKAVVGKEAPKDGSKIMRKVGAFRKQLRKQSRESDFNKLQGRLNTYYNTIQLMLELIIWTHAQQSRSVTNASLKELKVNTTKSLDDIKDGLAFLQSQVSISEAQFFRDSISSAIPVVSPNEHFSVPQGVEKNYTGRMMLFDEVKRAFNAPLPPDQVGVQKRIVIEGLGGSGKTQFCCKYASFCRQSYWGIFWINAGSDELAKRTYQDIAKTGGVARNVNAAKHWLSNLKRPWLLIVDNADNPRVKLDHYFPEGEGGHILITTRVPAHKDYGTVGTQFFHFEGLEQKDGNELLLKAASKPLPPDSLTEKLVTSITRALGSLPLALIYAGKAINRGLCKLDDYLQYHAIQRQKIRDTGSKGSTGHDELYIDVYSAFEVNFLGLTSQAMAESEAGRTEVTDAIQLLRMFGFLHHDHIRLDFLINAMTYPKIEQEQHLKERQREEFDKADLKSRSWEQILRSMAVEILQFISKDRTPPVLPEILRNANGFGPENKVRLRAALNELTQLSLITYNDKDNDYSMHPVVHEWARERPDFSAIEQAVWCQAAANALAQNILLPPLANTEKDERLRRDLVPHVDHVRERQQEIQEAIIRKRATSKKPSWLFSKPRQTETHITQLVKFSRVYAQCGRWDQAKRLQLEVEEFVAPLGPEHPSTIRIKLALSGTYWHLGHGNEAAELQSQVLQAHVNLFGEGHPDTLKVMDILGESRWQQGRFDESLQLHERAFEGMRPKLGPQHENALKAADNLGRAHTTFWRMEQARKLHAMAVAGTITNEKLGPMHLDTLVAMDNLALTYLEKNPIEYNSGEDLDHAYQILVEVVISRVKKLGKEHPYTLWATANLARVKGAQGKLAEAESDLRAGVRITTRDLGSGHIGTLFGKFHLGHNLLRQERVPEAIELLVEVADGYQRTGSTNDGEHPDRITALHHLCVCYKKQGKIEQAVKTCEEAIGRLTVISGETHPYMKQLKGIREELRTSRTASQASPGSERVHEAQMKSSENEDDPAIEEEPVPLSQYVSRRSTA